MATAKAGVGTTIKIGTTSGSISAIAKVLTIGGPSLSAESVECTTLDSTSGYKEFIGGLRQGGEVQLELYCQKGSTAQELLKTAAGDGTQLWCYIEWPTSPLDGVQFYCNVNTYGRATAANEGIKASVGLTLTAAPVWGTLGTLVYDANATRNGYNVGSSGVWVASAGEVGYAYGEFQWGGYGFHAVTVARYAVINSAILTTAALTDLAIGTSFPAEIRVEDADNPTQWQNAHTPGLISTYWGTTVACTPTLGQALAVDVTALVQHIVNRSGWSSGNKINLALKATSSAENVLLGVPSPAHLAILAS